MSTTSTARALPRSSTRPVQRTGPTPRLRVVQPTPGRSRTGLAVLSITLLVTGLLTLLMLNISIGKGAYTLTSLRKSQLQASEQQQALAEQVEDRSAPQRLADRAQQLGMVPAPNTAFVRLSDGRVVGDAAPATAAPRPSKPKPASDAKKQDAASGVGSASSTTSKSSSTSAKSGSKSGSKSGTSKSTASSKSTTSKSTTSKSTTSKSTTSKSSTGTTKHAPAKKATTTP